MSQELTEKYSHGYQNVNLIRTDNSENIFTEFFKSNMIKFTVTHNHSK